MTDHSFGKIGFVDLATGEIREETPDESLLRDFIGGYGIGVRILFERQKKGVDPLGPENILGFTTGPLTGTATPTGGRYMAVCKSPLTGGWGDSNAGGYFGSELRAAGWVALFVTGIAPGPRYLHIHDGKISLHDASHLWGKDTTETEEILQKELGDSKVRIACIGPAGERRSLISGIVNDHGRVAARSGVGAVMGAKMLKAVAVRGTGKAFVADPEALDRHRKAFIAEFRDMKGFPEVLRKYGTCGITAGLVASGATPVKNWMLAGQQDFPHLDKIAHAETLIQYQKRKYGCANCPIVCGGIFEVSGGKYPVGQVKKPEYETVGAFGTMCMNDDFESIVKLNDMCNRAGMDTISAGTAIAFAMECCEHGILSSSDTDGIALTWGNADAMIALLEKMIRREGLGDILADGVKIAAEKIGDGASEFAMHVGGQEPGLHNATFLPGRGTGFVCDPTPGRHTAAPMARLDGGEGRIGPYPELKFGGFQRLDCHNKGPMSATSSCYLQTGACSGVCLFPLIFFGNYPLLEYLNAVTGWNMDMPQALEAGARIQTLRQCFNIREGISPADIKLPPRMQGIPPKEKGPLAGAAIDIQRLRQEYWKAMGWDPENGHPLPDTLERLGLKKLLPPV